eukprot:4097395-Pyramimonas_sp.AAC.1
MALSRQLALILPDRGAADHVQTDARGATAANSREGLEAPMGIARFKIALVEHQCCGRSRMEIMKERCWGVAVKCAGG